MEMTRIAKRLSFVGIVGNILLSAFKLYAGILGKSGAMVSDAVHSLSDVFATCIAYFGVIMSKRPEDREHPYGHERMECVAAIILAVMLALVGGGIGYSGIMKIMSGENLKVPGMLALVAAIISIATKEWMYWYTRAVAKKINSDALMADAWHHRSDAFSSIGALIGIGGARLGFPIMDPIASLFIFWFIAKAALDIFKDAIDKMIDRSCDEETEKHIRECVMKTENVIGIELLKTRIFGNKIYVDVEIKVDSIYTLEEAHLIAKAVHNTIEETFPKVKHIMVYLTPGIRE
mgnify:CR=1 FL=1